MNLCMIIEDLHNEGKEVEGYLAARVRERLEAVAESGHPEEGAVFLDGLVERVQIYRTSLSELDVPDEELVRHRLLLSAFGIYEQALLALFDSIVHGEVYYEPALLQELHWADGVVKAHREHSAQNQLIDAYF